MTISPDGKQALSCGRDKAVRLWDLGGGNQVLQFEGHGDFALRLAFSPDGRRAVSGTYESWNGSQWVASDFSVRLWDVATGKEVRQSENTQDIRCVAFSPDGRQAVSGGTDAANRGDFAIRLWNADTGKEIFRLTGHTGDVRMAVFSPDPIHLVRLVNESVEPSPVAVTCPPPPAGSSGRSASLAS